MLRDGGDIFGCRDRGERGEIGLHARQISGVPGSTPSSTRP